MNGSRVDDLGDGEGTDESGSQLPGHHAKRKVFQGQPDPLTWLVGRGWSAMAIGSLLIQGGRVEEHGSGFSPHEVAPVHQRLG